MLEFAIVSQSLASRGFHQLQLLIVDVGNTDIKRAIATGDTLGEVTRNPTSDVQQIAEEIANAGMPVALSCVRQVAADAIKAALAKRGVPLAVEVNGSVNNPVSGFYVGMGADRVANVAGAWAEFGGKSPVAVVALGTGTTITAVSADGRFSGGFTTLGLGPICQSLTAALPALPAINPNDVSELQPGFDVYSALCRGTVAGHVGIIEKWVGIMRAELGPDMAVVATGGWSQLIGPMTSCVQKIDPLLTLKGILTIARTNK